MTTEIDKSIGTPLCIKRMLLADRLGFFKRSEGHFVEYRRWEPQCDGIIERVKFPDGSTRACYWENVPDYPNDLNAMHQVEKAALTDEQIINYTENLRKETGSAYGSLNHVSSTALQRFEALGKTLGLWE